MYLIDASKSVTEESLDKMKTSIQDQINLYKISPSAARISFVAYGNKSNIILPLRNGISSVVVKAALNKLRKLGGERKLDIALKTIRNVILSPLRDARAQASKLVIVYITGPNNPKRFLELKQEANRLKSVDTEVQVIGIGSDLKDEELHEVSSAPRNVAKVKSVNDVEEAIPAISEAVGQATGILHSVVSCLIKPTIVNMPKCY